jgi:hypothetical protein
MASDIEFLKALFVGVEMPSKKRCEYIISLPWVKQYFNREVRFKNNDDLLKNSILISAN